MHYGCLQHVPISCHLTSQMCLSTHHYNRHNVYTKQNYDRGCGSEYSSKMTKWKKKRFSAGEVIEAIFTDEDSNDEHFDCGFIRLTQMMEQGFEWIQRFFRLCYIIFFRLECDISEWRLRLKESAKIRLEIFFLLHEYVLKVTYIIYCK